ncbi:hypothetical protein GK047_12660 [Paenibacillus sp. SYP-B3998]|uniref:Uncharacterized protein n=1 Tax=Paenibacillus sp. SYP-B3998 TaxID=2678564 RepID=A0A6G3ZZM4_9BACL|nr:hypothetical protein [Paenibacillus sp. SYP-B3998]NEW06857.1 hypothetical protein [Paenibacillus sp. SYP-B3998]
MKSQQRTEIMNAGKFIEEYSSNQVKYISFQWNGKHANEMVDDNLDFRREIIKYLESINYHNINGELLRDLLIAESQYAKEAWGIYRHYNLLAENLIRQTGKLYLDDFLISASLSFDTYCSTLAVDLTDIDIDEYIIEIYERRAMIQKENMIKTYDMGIDIFLSYKAKQSKANDLVRQEINTSKPNILKNILRFIKKIFVS